MSLNAKTLNREEFFYGHKACAGCGGSLAVRIALKVLGERSVAVLPAGCMSAVGFNFPQLCFGNNAIISTFAGTASMLTGIEAGLRAKGETGYHAVGFAGDGGTADIGIQALSGAMESGYTVVNFTLRFSPSFSPFNLSMIWSARLYAFSPYFASTSQSSR